MEVGKASLEAYGNYEQLAGGAQLMFGDAYATVAENAKNAYKTVQMSQNDYLQQVNGFATGLKTALGGNEQAAADLAHKIIVAEADVVAATGNTQEAVQNAFNGIMKSNYTMLDNLQLGITPTKEGFQEVIDKVNEWNEAQGNATNYTIANLADCQSALVDYITMQGLAGYAGMEASGTIQGSTASMKAAWENLSAGMADETADMEQLAAAFVDSVGAAADNTGDRVKQIVRGVANAAGEIGTYLKTTNRALGTVITALESVAVGAASAGAAFLLIKVGSAVSNIAAIFSANAAALAFFTAESGKAAVAQAVLDGEFAVGEVLVGVLTGKISLATAAQYAWNAALNANPIGLVLTLVAALGVSIKWLADAEADRAAAEEAENEAMLDGIETAEQAAEKLRELQDEYGRLIAYQTEASENGYRLGPEWHEQMGTIEQQLALVQERYEELAVAEAAAAEEAERLAQADVIESAAATYTESAEALIDSFYGVYESVYNGLYNASTMFTEVSSAMTISFDELLGNLRENADFNQRYADSLDYIKGVAGDANINIDGFFAALTEMDPSKAAGVVEAVRKELEAADGDSLQIRNSLDNLVDSMGSYEEAAESAANSVATAVVDVEKELQKAYDDYVLAIEGLDNYDELYEAGKKNMEGLLKGLQENEPGVLGQLEGLASSMKSKLQTSFNDFSLTVTAVVKTIKEDATDGSHKTGLDYVPFDGYIAELHKGETVLTAEEAAAYRAGVSTSGGSVASESVDGIARTLTELLGATYDMNRLLQSDRTFQVGSKEFGRLVRSYA